MDIRDLDKARVLKALYNNSRIAVAAIAYGTYKREDMTTEQARKVIEERSQDRKGLNLYFDYLFGRVIKTDLSQPLLDLCLYDRDNGSGAGERAILEEFTRPGAEDG